VVVENMQAQMEQIIAAGPPAARPPRPEVVVQPGETAAIAVAAGDGLADIFYSLGASGVVNGGQTNNPSTEEIYKIIESLSGDRVIILPNNKNIILAAQAAADLSKKQVTVVPTRTIPQGITALLALDRRADLAKAADTMQAAAESVASGEITTATRSVVLDGVEVNEGETVGLANGRLVAADPDIDLVLDRVLEEMGVAGRELVSIYYGAGADERQAGLLADKIRQRYPDLEVELLAGGQPVYQYILGAE
jgi:dihydroxyacetone kinase-like predicted kinase